ncbi:hypothetical protein [Gordonia malaquae]
MALSVGAASASGVSRQPARTVAAVLEQAYVESATPGIPGTAGRVGTR